MKTNLSTFPKQPFYVKEIKEWKKNFTKELIELGYDLTAVGKEILGQ